MATHRGTRQARYPRLIPKDLGGLGDLPGLLAKEQQ